jgi:hypothetical protein
VAQGHVYPQVDGRDLGTSFRQRNHVYRNTGQMSFDEVGERAVTGLAGPKSSRAVLPVDLEGDGDLDLLVTHLNDRPDLLRNDSAPASWLAVRLEGAGGNTDGIGARVTVVAGDRTHRRQIRTQASLAGSKLPIAHFGLGAAQRVERVEVRWPGGEISTFDDVETGQVLTVREAR